MWHTKHFFTASHPVDGDYSFDDEIDTLIRSKSARRPSTISDETNWRSQTKSLSDSYPSASASWPIFSNLDPVASSVDKENLAWLPNFAVWLQGSPASLAITFCIAPLSGLRTELALFQNNVRSQERIFPGYWAALNHQNPPWGLVAGS